jgi:hypothetical protein
MGSGQDSFTAPAPYHAAVPPGSDALDPSVSRPCRESGGFHVLVSRAARGIACPFIRRSSEAPIVSVEKEDPRMVRKLAFSLALAAGLVSPLALPAEAAFSVGAFAPPAALEQTSPVETAQFFWGGRRYCWYNSAWRGPGWYQCGFAWRRGFGWGGPAGWHGWRRPPVHHRPPVHRPRPPVHRPPAHRPPHHRPPAHQRPPAHRPGGSGQRNR